MLTGAYTTVVLLPINYPLNLTGQKQAVFNYSQYQGSKIDNPAARTDSMMRLHEAMGGSIDQGNLAIDRLSTFIAEKRATPAGTPLIHPLMRDEQCRWLMFGALVFKLYRTASRNWPWMSSISTPKRVGTL